MQTKFLFCILLVSALTAVGCLMTVDLSPNSFPNATGADNSMGNPKTIFFEDFFAILEYLDGSSKNLKIYEYEADKSDYTYLLSYKAASLYMLNPASNGKWFATDDYLNTVLFQLGSPNPANITSTVIYTAGSIVYSFRILPDDSVVVVKSTGVETYTLNGTEVIFNNILDITIRNTGGAVFYDLTDTHFINWNSSGGFQIYARSPQLGWDLIDDHVTNSSYRYRLTGGPPAPTTLIDPQTVMVRSQLTGDPRDPNSQVDHGFIIIISKVDGIWKDQIFLASDFTDQDPTGTLGLSAMALDSNNVLIGVPQEGNSPYKRSVDAVKDITPGSYGAAYFNVVLTTCGN